MFFFQCNLLEHLSLCIWKGRAGCLLHLCLCCMSLTQIISASLSWVELHWSYNSKFWCRLSENLGRTSSGAPWLQELLSDVIRFFELSCVDMDVVIRIGVNYPSAEPTWGWRPQHSYTFTSAPNLFRKIKSLLMLVGWKSRIWYTGSYKLNACIQRPSNYVQRPWLSFVVGLTFLTFSSNCVRRRWWLYVLEHYRREHYMSRH